VLRTNLASESKACIDAFGSVLDIMLPMQVARFYLRISFVHSSVLQLKTLWEAVQSNSPASASQPAITSSLSSSGLSSSLSFGDALFPSLGDAKQALDSLSSDFIDSGLAEDDTSALLQSLLKQ
jgi:hypothetical protein